MGTSFSSVETTKNIIKQNIEDEINRRMMVQREVQMAVNIAQARDTIHVFGSLWLALVSGISIAHIAGKPVSPMAPIPVVIGAVILGNMADLAYGNKLARVNKEANHILMNERARLVPFPRAPFAKFYSTEERAIFYDPATAVGDLPPFGTICRSFTPRSKSGS